MYKFIIFFTTIIFLNACGPIANQGAKAINKSLNKGAKELIDVSDNSITRTFRDQSDISREILEFNSFVSKNFPNNPNINYFYKLNTKHSQLPKKWIDEFEDVWLQSIKNNELYYDDLYYNFFTKSFNNKIDFLSHLPKAESVLIASILGFSFTYTEKSDAASGGMIQDIDIKDEMLTKKEVKKIQCSQAHDLVSIRKDIKYSDFAKNLENCPVKKLNLDELKKKINNVTN